MTYFHDGTPYSGVNTTNDSGTTAYWQDGTPFALIFEETTVSPIKSVGGVVWANIKKISGVAIANVKKISSIST